MHSKIRKLRMVLNLTETQISNLLNISNYKYRRCEEGTMEFPTETIILLSIIFQIPLDYLLYDRYSVEEILDYSNLKKLSNQKWQDVIGVLEKNICMYCPYKCSKISYRVIRCVVQKKQKIFSENIKKVRCNKLLDIEDVVIDLKITKELYQNIENLICLPDINFIIELANYFGVSADSLFE